MTPYILTVKTQARTFNCLKYLALDIMKTLLLENTENVRYCNHHLVSVKLGLSGGKERLQGPNKRKEGRRRKFPQGLVTTRPSVCSTCDLEPWGLLGTQGQDTRLRPSAAQLEQARVRLALKGTLPLMGVTSAFRQSYLTCVSSPQMLGCGGDTMVIFSQDFA